MVSIYSTMLTVCVIASIPAYVHEINIVVFPSDLECKTVTLTYIVMRNIGISVSSSEAVGLFVRDLTR